MKNMQDNLICILEDINIYVPVNIYIYIYISLHPVGGL